MDTVIKGDRGGNYWGNSVSYTAARVVMNENHLCKCRERHESQIVEARHRWQASERFPMVGELTGMGAMRGIVFEDTATASGSKHLMALLSAVRDAGVLLMPSGRRHNVLRMLPTLTTEPQHSQRGLNYIEQALESLKE